MADVTSTSTLNEVQPAQGGAKVIQVETVNTVDDTDTILITLADFGISTFQGILGFTHSTEDSVVITEAPTTAVAAGVLTITVGGSTDNKKRVFYVYGK